jgi:hypothetical protein
VGACDELDDREAESRASAASGLVGAAEAVEGSLAERLREALALVTDVELDESGALVGGELDRAGAVGEGVVDKVDERLADTDRIGLGAYVRLFDVELPSQRTRTGRKPLGRVGEQVADREDLAPDRERALVGPGDEKEIVGEPGQSLRLLRR